MNSQLDKKSQSRLLIAGALFLTSILASFLIAYLSSSGGKYWVLSHPISRGVQLSPSDLSLVKVTFGRSAHGYISEKELPVGAVTLRNLAAGELLNRSDLSRDPKELKFESISLSVRAVDIPQDTSSGDIVSLYQVFDARNGEVVPAPQRIISGVFIKEISRKSANFGSELSLTITVLRDEVPVVLAATSSGRIVVVASRG